MEFELNKTYKLQKPPHIFEGVIIMPGSPVQIQEKNADGTFNVLYHDREMMPHVMKNIRVDELSV